MVFFNSDEERMNIPTIQVNNILFPTDLSDNARYAFAYAVSLATLYRAKITLLHVLPEEQKNLDSHLSGYVQKEKWAEIKDSHYQQTRESLTGKIRHHSLMREVQNLSPAEGSASEMADEIVIEHGKPTKEILRQAEERNCDMIVMGSRGHSTLAGAILGGITERVLRKSNIPVLVVRLPEDD
jgi:nucleotide-binding universal stress UspA family protein